MTNQTPDLTTLLADVTPGSWTVHRNISGGYTICAKDGSVVGTVYKRHKPEEARANAELICRIQNAASTVRDRINGESDTLEVLDRLEWIIATGEVIELHAQLAEARDVFGDLLSVMDEDIGMEDWSDDEGVASKKDKQGNIVDIPLTFGHLRRARTFLAKLDAEQSAKEEADG